MSTEADTILDDDLTDEEREALNYQEPAEDVNESEQPTEESDADEATPADNADAAHGTGDDDSTADDAGATAAADAVPESQPAAAEPVAKQPEVAPAPAPILIAEAPADAQAKLDAIATAKAELIDKYEAGDLTAKEYQTQIDALNNDQFEIKSAVREAELARKMESQRQQNQWDAECRSFLDGHKEYHGQEGAERYQALDEAIKVMARLPVNRGISGQALLTKAHAMVQTAYGEVAPAKEAAKKVEQPKVPKPAIPPTNIGKLPQADANDTTGGEFAALDKLAKSNDVDAYEDAIARLTPLQRDRYMRR